MLLRPPDATGWRITWFNKKEQKAWKFTKWNSPEWWKVGLISKITFCAYSNVWNNSAFQKSCIICQACKKYSTSLTDVRSHEYLIFRNKLSTLINWVYLFNKAIHILSSYDQHMHPPCQKNSFPASHTKRSEINSSGIKIQQYSYHIKS